MAHPHNNPTCDKDFLEELKDSTHSKDKQLSSCSSNNAIVQHLAEKVESNGKTISKDSTDKSNSRKRKLRRSPHQIPGTEVTCSHSNLSLRQHLAIHTGEKTLLSCQICKVEFIRKQELSSHNWSHHLSPEDKERVKAGSCYFCAKPFQTHSKLQKHLLIHTQEKHFNCSSCKKQFIEKGQLTKHVFQHLSPEEQEKERVGWKHPCEFCGVRFKVQSSLYTHITVQHTKEKHYQCQICRKEFNQQGTLTIHLRTHSEDPSTRKPFSCSQCQKSFTSKGSLKSHLFVHLPPEEQERQKSDWKHPCNFCGARFKIESSLHWHITSVHTKEKHYQCTICRKEFNRQGHLTRHLRSHSEDPAILKPFSCSQCQKTFTNKSHLTHHEKTVHLGLKDFVCPQCHKCFSEKSKLSSHLFVHLPPEEQEDQKREWKHPCNFCGARFKIQSSLHLHITLVHTKEKHYQCQICRKEFNHQGNLTRHLRSHSDDPAILKPFSCSQCQKTFTNKSNLTRHEKTVHLGLKDFVCPQCHKQFSGKSHLTRHLTSVHAKVRHSCSKTFSRESDARSHERKAH